VGQARKEPLNNIVSSTVNLPKQKISVPKGKAMSEKQVICLPSKSDMIPKVPGDIAKLKATSQRIVVLDKTSKEKGTVSVKIQPTSTENSKVLP